MRIGIDIGGTKIVAGLVDITGKVVARKRILVGHDKSYLIVRDAIIMLVRDILSENNIHTESLERIGQHTHRIPGANWRCLCRTDR